MRKLIVVLTALLLSATPVVGQVQVRAFTFEGEGTFENVACYRVAQTDGCVYSQGSGSPQFNTGYLIYPMLDRDAILGADACWTFGPVATAKGDMDTPEARAWANANMVGRRFCVRFEDWGLLDVADGMSYLRNPAAEAALLEKLSEEIDRTPTPTPEGGSLFRQT